MDTASMFAMGAASQQMRSVASLYGGVKTPGVNGKSSNIGDKLIGDSIKQNVDFSLRLIEENNRLKSSSSSSSSLTSGKYSIYA